MQVNVWWWHTRVDDRVWWSLLDGHLWRGLERAQPHLLRHHHPIGENASSFLHLRVRLEPMSRYSQTLVIVIMITRTNLHFPKVVLGFETSPSFCQCHGTMHEALIGGIFIIFVNQVYEKGEYRRSGKQKPRYCSFMRAVESAWHRYVKQ